MAPSFHFSIFDDTDNGTVANLTPVYRFLEEIGIRATKSVWPLRGPGHPAVRIAGETLEDAPYREFVLDLQRRGFELALHGVQNGSAERARIEQGLEQFREVTGDYPRLNTNHSRNRDNMYWDESRFSDPGVRAVMRLNRFNRQIHFEGHVPGSEYFWGDIYKERITYHRNFAFNETNLNRVNPSMPYRDASRPFVNYWFSSTDGADVQRFCRALSERRQDQLEAEQGVCIMYTHFASGFVEHGKLHPKFESLMRCLARKSGVFLTVGALLDKLREQPGRGGEIPRSELVSMERRWLRQKLLKGRT